MKNNKVKNLVLSAAFAALIFAATRFISFPIPGGLGGYVHLGDALIYLCAAVLPTPWAIGAAAVGAGIADATAGALIWLPGTVVIKAVMALVFTWSDKRIINPRNLVCSVVSGIICTGGYFLYEWLLVYRFMIPDGGAPLALAAAGVPFNALQALTSAVVFIIAGYSLDRASLKSKL